VQRDILPIIEGTTVNTRMEWYGRITFCLLPRGHSMFRSQRSDPGAAGAVFHSMELQSLTMEDFVRILTEPKSSLVKQYTALSKRRAVSWSSLPEALDERLLTSPFV